MNLTLVQAIIIVLIIIVVFCLVSHSRDVIITDTNAEANLITELHPSATVLTKCEIDNAIKSQRAQALNNNQWAAHTNNTLPVRPGTKYALDIHPTLDANDLPPAFTITLYYKPGCTAHQLTMLFEHIAKEMMNDGTAANASIQFERKMIDVCNPLNLVGGFPKITKTRRNGQVLEYKGYTDYGPLRDWILNEGLLF